MVIRGRQKLGLVLAILGFLGSILVCVLPTWRVTFFIGANIITAQEVWEGLWMVCVSQITGQMQCKVYEGPLLALPQDLQAARALVVLATVAGAIGTLLGFKVTYLVAGERAKCKVAIGSGVVFIMAGLLVLVPVCLTANAIIRDFHDPTLPYPQKRDLGDSLYIGWCCAGLLFLGGGLLCSSCPPSEENDVKLPSFVVPSVDSTNAYRNMYSIYAHK